MCINFHLPRSLVFFRNEAKCIDFTLLTPTTTSLTLTPRPTATPESDPEADATTAYAEQIKHIVTPSKDGISYTRSRSL